jgi:OPT oligopeptide transporter protein
MFLTQVYGTVLGAFVNYAVMISVVGGNRDLLINSNGDSSWSGASIQSFNTNATSWALANYLYKTGAKYSIVPIGLLVGAGLVALHRIVVIVSATYFPPRKFFYSSLRHANPGCS